MQGFSGLAGELAASKRQERASVQEYRAGAR